MEVAVARWDLFRLLSEKVRFRILALADAEELTIGELAEILGDSQPNVSRHIATMKQASLLTVRKEGTRTFVRLNEGTRGDAVLSDALRTGRSLCENEGKFQKVEELLERRDEASKAYFSTPQARATLGYAAEFPAFLRAFSYLLDSRRLAIDVGTGDGRMLDLLAPTFEHVVAVDRSEAQIQTAKERVRLRNYSNVKLIVSEVSSAELKRLAKPGADVVVASRVLHHAPSPGDRVKELSELLRPGGTLLVIDYATHEDESMREKADLWLGFAPAELKKFARSAGFDSVHLEPLPRALTGEGEDGHLEWQILIAKKARAS